MPAQVGAVGCLHEVYAATDDWAAATIFALTMLADARGGAKTGPVLIIRSPQGGLPAFLYGEGLSALGIAPELLLLVHTPTPLEMLCAGLEAARCPGIAAVVMEIGGRCREWDLTASRRFSLAAEQSGAIVLILHGDVEEQPSSAQTRWKITSAPSVALPADAPGLPVIDAELLRQRGGPAGMCWRLQWDSEYGGFREAALSGAVVPLSGLRAGPAELPAARAHAA